MPPPPPAGGFLDVPSQLNEQQTYDNVLGWTWSTSAKATTFGANPGPQDHGGNITNNSEADDLWNHYQAYKRTGNNVYLQWAQRWRDYFVNTYFNQWAAGDGQEHTYGQGLILWGMERNDSAALTAAEQIAARIETMYAGVNPGYPMCIFGGRMRGRHLLVVCYQAYANPIARWITLRDKLINLWMASPDWQEGGVIAAGGHYFAGDALHASFPEMGSHAAGFRVNSAFQYTILSEALWRAYKLTARVDIRDRLILMARYINHYCNNTALVNPMSGSWYGHTPSGGHHFPRGGGGGNPNAAPADPVYETAHVNALVIGYKLTGDTALLTKARGRFRAGTQYADGGAGTPKQPDNLVHHYTDTRDNGEGYFAYNKGELQYNYLMFENGGVPSVEA